MSPSQYEQKLALNARTRETSKGYNESGMAARDQMLMPDGRTVLQAREDVGRAAIKTAWDARQPVAAPDGQDAKRAKWGGKSTLLTGGGSSGGISGGLNMGGGSLLGG